MFKNGQISDAPRSDKVSKVFEISPPDSIVRKIIVGYDRDSYVVGFKLLDAKGTCVLDVGDFGFA